MKGGQDEAKRGAARSQSGAGCSVRHKHGLEVEARREQPPRTAKGSAGLGAFQNPPPLPASFSPPRRLWTGQDVGPTLKLAAESCECVHVASGQGPLLGFGRPL